MKKREITTSVLLIILAVALIVAGVWLTIRDRMDLTSDEVVYLPFDEGFDPARVTGIRAELIDSELHIYTGSDENIEIQTDGEGLSVREEHGQIVISQHHEHGSQVFTGKENASVVIWLPAGYAGAITAGLGSGDVNVNGLDTPGLDLDITCASGEISVYSAVFGTLLTSANGYVLLKTFMIPTVEGYVTESQENSYYEDVASEAPQDAETTGTSYSDENIQISISTVRYNDTDVYIADVKVSSAAYLKTALANDTFGRNVTQKTSGIASAHNAILAINGDYYGANSQGYVIKNGVIYRDTARRNTEYDDLVIYKDGSFGIINESEVTAQALLDSGVMNLFAFGPTLVKNGSVSISQNEEVGRAMANNPRTAIGIIDDLHYILVVSDGRTNASQGLSLYELAQVMQQYGCKTAYNLDGGGSSTMYFNGQVINNPTTNGNRISERSVSDIVYIGY